MGVITRANVHDVLTHAPRDRVVVVDGEKRIVKRPEARSAEQFIDLQGNVVWLQLLKFGVNGGVEHIDKERGVLHRRGFVEYHLCPLRHGTHIKTPKLESEFDERPSQLEKPCADDPTIHVKKGRHWHAEEACPHVQWLIHDRREREEEARALRATRIESAADLEKQKISIAEQQLEESRKTNNRLVAAIEQLAGGKPKKPDGKPEPKQGE